MKKKILDIHPLPWNLYLNTEGQGRGNLLKDANGNTVVASFQVPTETLKGFLEMVNILTPDQKIILGQKIAESDFLERVSTEDLVMELAKRQNKGWHYTVADDIMEERCEELPDGSSSCSYFWIYKHPDTMGSCVTGQVKLPPRFHEVEESLVEFTGAILEAKVLLEKSGFKEKALEI